MFRDKFAFDDLAFLTLMTLFWKGMALGRDEIDYSWPHFKGLVSKRLIYYEWYHDIILILYLWVTRVHSDCGFDLESHQELVWVWEKTVVKHTPEYCIY